MKTMKAEYIDFVSYQETENGEWKYGVSLDDGNHIIGLDGKEPEKVWDYQRSSLEAGNIDVEMETDELVIRIKK